MKKRVVILFDLASEPPPEQNYRSFEKDDSWDHEIDVKRALQRLGYEVFLVGVYDDITRLVAELNEIKPDIVFNMAESFENKRAHEPHVAGVLELLNIPYTGTRALGLSICKDKALTKKILSHHRIRVPDWIISKKTKPLRKLKNFRFPAFVKSTTTEGSEGISKDSFVENEADCLERVHYLHEKFNSDVLIEEFIEGRELYVSVLGNGRIKVLPFREITFSRIPDDEPKFATYKTKWDEAYRKKWGIRNVPAKDLPEEVIQKASKMAKRAFEILDLKAYARFDFRVRPDGEVVMLEANPNPSIVSYDDFAQSAKKAGIEYDQLIQKLVHLSTAS